MVGIGTHGRRSSVLAVLLVLLAATVLVPAGSAFGDPLGQRRLTVNTPNGTDDIYRMSPDGRWVIFPADRDGQFDLWIVPVDAPGTTPERVNPPVAGRNVYDYQFSPDSQYVVFVGPYETDSTIRPLYSRPVDLSEPATRLSVHPGGNSTVWYSFAISPDSTTVVYRGDLTVDGQNDLYSRPIDASGPQVRLTNDPAPGGAVSGIQPLITPDSSRVVFRGTLDDPATSELYSAPLGIAGGQVKLNDTPVTGGEVSGSWAITADSSRVVFMGDLDVDGDPWLYSSPIDTSDQITLSDVTGGAGSGVAEFRLTPDGSRAVYRGDLETLNTFELFVRPADGSGPQQKINDPLAGGGSVYASFRIAPDNAHVVYRVQPSAGAPRQLVAHPLGPSGSEVTLSTDAVGTDGVDLFELTPDGTHVVFSGELATAGRDDVFSRPIDASSPPVRLTTTVDGADVGDLLVAPDGSRVVIRGDLATDTVFELFSAPIGIAGQQVAVSETGNPDGDVDLVSFLPDSSAVVYQGDLVASADGVDHLWVSDIGQLPPPAPTAVQVDRITGSTARVRWTPPPYSRVDTYTVTVSPPASPAAVRSRAAATTVSGTSTTIEGLDPETDYLVAVTASNRGGEGGTSAPVAFTTLTADGVVRLSGDDRYETAVAVALDRFDPADVDTVYLATGTNFPDALAGGPLAAATDSPILLVQPTALPDVVAGALGTLQPSDVVALGGEVAVSQAVLDAAAAAAGGASTDRLSGPDRYATAVAIAQALGGTPSTVFLATGTNFPDALAGGPATGGAPILLSNPAELSVATADALAGLAPERVVALGGTVALSDEVLHDAAAAAGGADTDRLSASDRYATAVDIAQTLGDVDVVYVAVGTKFPDALAAGPAATAEGAPIVLTVPDALPDLVRAHIDGLTGLRRVVVLGGQTVVSQAVADDLTTLLD